MILVLLLVLLGVESKCTNEEVDETLGGLCFWSKNEPFDRTEFSYFACPSSEHGKGKEQRLKRLRKAVLHRLLGVHVEDRQTAPYTHTHTGSCAKIDTSFDDQKSFELCLSSMCSNLCPNNDEETLTFEERLPECSIQHCSMC